MLKLDAFTVSAGASNKSPLSLLRRQAQTLGARVRSANLWLSCGEPDLLRKLQPAWVGASPHLHLPTGVGPVGLLTRAALGFAIGELRVPRVIVCGHSNCALEVDEWGAAADDAIEEQDFIARVQRAQARLAQSKARVAAMVHDIRHAWRDSVTAGELDVLGLFYLNESGTLLRFDPMLHVYEAIED